MKRKNLRGNFPQKKIGGEGKILITKRIKLKIEQDAHENAITLILLSNNQL